MRRVLWIAAGCVASAAPLARWFGSGVWLGMLGPLLAGAASWVLVERTYRTNPQRSTAVMIGAFAGKLIFFGAYVGAVIGVFGVRPVPFAISLTGYFVALHLIEALWLKRLFV